MGVGSGRTESRAQVRGKTVQSRGSGGGLVGGTLLREGLQLGAPGLGGARDSRGTRALVAAWIGAGSCGDRRADRSLARRED